MVATTRNPSTGCCSGSAAQPLQVLLVPMVGQAIVDSQPVLEGMIYIMLNDDNPGQPHTSTRQAFSSQCIVVAG